jgi:hypothetical protein
MKVFEVTLTTHHQVLMEAADAAEARECMRLRCCREIGQAQEYQITAVEVTVKPEDRGRVLVS